MKRKILFLVIGLALILSACKSNDQSEEVKSILPERSYPQYEYNIVMTRCSRDGTNMMCTNIGEKEAGSLDSMLSAKGLEGWELVNILSSKDNKGTFQTFIFKRIP